MQWKRMTCLVLAMLMLCMMVPFQASAKEASVTATNIDSARGVGELVIYTPAYGDNTDTNWWGMEAVVGADNRVIELAPGKSDIPSDGFVLSGHDDDSVENGSMMKTWIMENIAVGDYVYYDKRTMKITVSDVPLEMEESVFYEVTAPITAFNTSRNEDTLIVYTPVFGANTGTNEYGYEIVVDDGAIVTQGGNGSAIPVKGFVVSAHGAMVNVLRTAVINGMRAEYDKEAMVVRFVYDADSLKQAVANAVDDTVAAIDSAKSAYVYVDYEAAETTLEAIRSEYDAAVKAYESDGNDAVFADACDNVIADLQDVQNSMCDSYPVQYRGVWVRPSQKTASEVNAYVKELVDAGINMISVEGIFESGVIMEVPEGSLFQKHPDFSFDVLQAYIDACHEYGIECHLWMPIMNVGDKGYRSALSVLSKKPEWASLNQKGTADNPSGFMMIDPANQEAREYLLSFYEYLVTNYDVDAFELDYIRYHAVSSDLDYGYTEAAFAGFEEAYGYGVTPTYAPTAAYWDDWKQYRQDCVTEMVKAVREMIDRVAPDLILSADVAPTPADARNQNYQDYPRWLEEGLLDVLHPMAYGDGYGESLTNAVELGGEHTMIVRGLGSFSDSMGAVEMERQARENSSYGTYGDAYFDAASYLADKTYDELVKTVYRTPAIAPFYDRDASLTASLSYMQGRVEDVLLPLDGVTAEQANTLVASIQTARDAVADGRIESAAFAALVEAIASVDNADARAVLESDLLRVKRVQLTSDVSNDSGAETQPKPIPWLWIGLGGALAVIVAAAIVLVVLKFKKS